MMDAPGSKGRRGPAPLSLSGSVVALIGFLLALTPSLLPRPPLFLGLLAGIVAAIGYGLGVAVARLLHRAGAPGLPAARRRVASIAVAATAAVLIVGGVVLAASWQNDIRASIGVPLESGGRLLAAGVAAGTFLGLLALGRLLARLTHRAVGPLESRLPRPLAVLAAVVLVGLVVYWVAADLVVGGFMTGADVIYAGKNEGSAEGVEQPTSTLRSGGPESLVPWDSLGREGRAFVSGGPTAAGIAETTGRPAIDPVRVYVGLDSAEAAAERADLAVAELRRTGAFDREVLVVAGVAGTGWLEPQSIDGVEYVWGGDTAIVASQYSYLPSWISFLVDQDRAQLEGRTLFDAVWQEWSALPIQDRPRLIAYGLSLGSFSIQSAFATEAEMAEKTDGAILAGTPSFSEPWGSITASRDADSPMWQPVIGAGQTVRFADDATDLSALGPWQVPRIAYLQHADDPVVWWSFDLIAQRPDWLAEPRGPAVTTRMHWMPLITFLQVTVDQFFGVNQPNGYGHNYSAHMAQTWVDVVGAPVGWTQADTAMVQQQLTG